MNCKNCGQPTQAEYLNFCSNECRKRYIQKNNYHNSETYIEEKEHLIKLQSLAKDLFER